MAEESEKKIGAILIKHAKTNNAQPAGETVQKKKIVIKRKTTPASSDPAKTEKKRIVVSKKTHAEAAPKGCIFSCRNTCRKTGSE